VKGARDDEGENRVRRGGVMAGKKGGLFIKRWIFIRLSRKSENGYKVAAQDHELYWNVSR
jgi:hypothetical protein